MEKGEHFTDHEEIKTPNESNIFNPLSLELDSFSFDTLGSKKEKLLEKYPKNFEAVKTFFYILKFLEIQKIIEEKGRKEIKKMGDTDRQRLFKKITSLRLLTTHFFIENTDDRATLEGLWNCVKHVARAQNLDHIFERFQHSTLAQIAGFKDLEALGQKRRLANPEQDAFKAIDLWIENKKTVQIAGTAIKGSALKSVSKISFPVLQTEKGTTYFNANQEHNGILSKLDEYGKLIGKPLEGYDMRITYDQIDAATGAPSVNLFLFFKQALNHETKE